jgi:ElaB/YqjD/DUF883 family membrane-anchored ribosome-binding protein
MVRGRPHKLISPGTMNERIGDHEVELKELRQSIQAAIRRGLADVSQAASSRTATIPTNLSELESLLRKLGDQLSDVAEDAEDAIASHPLSSVGAAFVLGLAIGRLTRGTHHD